MFWSSHKEQQVRMYLTDVERTGERNHYKTRRHTAQSRWEMFYLYWYGCLALWEYIITGICLWFVIYLKSALHVFWNTLWNKLSFLLICIHLFHIYTHSSLYIYIYIHIYTPYIYTSSHTSSTCFSYGIRIPQMHAGVLLVFFAIYFPILSGRLGYPLYRSLAKVKHKLEHVFQRQCWQPQKLNLQK